jgi:thiol-disulfide isomerase/thioredoxin
MKGLPQHVMRSTSRDVGWADRDLPWHEQRAGTGSAVNNPRAYLRALLPIAVLAGVITVVSAALYELRIGTSSGGPLTVANHAAVGNPMNEPAPTFDLPALEGGSTIAFPPGGHVTVLNFWGSWCGPCAIEAPGLQRVWVDYRQRGVRFIGVDELDNDAAGQAFVREFGLTYPSAKDPAGSLVNDFALFGMPTTFVVDRDGTLRDRFVGYVDEGDLRRVLDKVLGGSG